ncbi:MAG: ligase-associated DNA damage response DEXH box helicase [Bacteroidota bacterium]
MNNYINIAKKWFKAKGWKPFPFQLEAWQACLDGKSGIVNAPTGSGKTYSLFIPALLEAIREEKVTGKTPERGLRIIWITPIRALTKEIEASANRAIEGLGLNWRVEVRSGDTSTSRRAKQIRNPPELLITTPESLHLLLATKDYPKFFRHLRTMVVDEWHELLGSKRGVQVELGLSRLKSILPGLKIWGISATIGNMDEAVQVLMGDWQHSDKVKLIKSGIKKKIEVVSVLPDEIETLPWAGHLGIKMLEKVVPILKESESTLIFCNTRAQCEIWYQKLLEADPGLAGQMAMHHSSISRELRTWVEEALHEGKLKAVVCTSSLDLGVDFRPVGTIVQIGSPKGVARFIQRAGRSGHQPGALSKIYFVPTHSLELAEAAALREAIEKQEIEQRIPFVRSFDVLVQYLVTLAVSEGFYPDQVFKEVKSTFCYNSISEAEFEWCLNFIWTGGDSLAAYDEFRKVDVIGGMYRVTDKGVALRHRLSMGTIVSDQMMQIKYVSGRRIGNVEEWFITQLKPGDIFWFAGRSLELVRVREMTVQVRKSKSKTGKVPSWQGGRMPLSSELTAVLRAKFDQVVNGDLEDPELKKLLPLFELQEQRSILPSRGEFLIEYFKSKEGHHLLFYPFEGRFVHEGLGAILAYRISKLVPISFSIAMNDYGLELLSPNEIPIEKALEANLLSLENLSEDIRASVNAVEMARRRFRDIASISGLVFKGFPGREKKDRHLQSSSQLFFGVFSDFEPDNLLLLQAYDEAMNLQLEEGRLRLALKRINEQKIRLSYPGSATPFAFPIMVDRLRERLTSEKLEDRIRRMKLEVIKS